MVEDFDWAEAARLRKGELVLLYRHLDLAVDLCDLLFHRFFATLDYVGPVLQILC